MAAIGYGNPFKVTVKFKNWVTGEEGEGHCGSPTNTTTSRLAGVYAAALRMCCSSSSGVTAASGKHASTDGTKVRVALKVTRTENAHSLLSQGAQPLAASAYFPAPHRVPSGVVLP